MFSLRGTISFLSAAAVALVAAITLSIALTSSLEALRTIGKDHSAVLLRLANTQTQNLFQAPVLAVQTVQNYTKAQAWGWPSDDANFMLAMETLHRTVHLSTGLVISGQITYFRDNTRFHAGYWNETHFEYTVTTASPVNTTGWDSNGFADNAGSQTFGSGLCSRLTAACTYTVGERQPVPLQQSGAWTTLAVPTGNGGANTFPGIIVVELSTGRIAVYIPVVAPLYFRGAARSPENVAGYTSAAVFTEQFSTFLASIRATPGTRAFTVDGRGYLLGSSEEATVPFVTKTVVPRGTPARSGCASTEGTAGVSVALTEATMVCRAHASEYGFAVLRAMAEDPALLRADAPVVQLLRVGGELYFAAAARVPLPYGGQQFQLLFAMPEADIIGDVVRSRNVAIGVTCGVFVLVASGTFAAISLLLAPLATVAERMRRAANFEDDEADASVSAMAEVRRLQEAYYDMNDELNRIRGFVPQAVLVRRRDENGEDEEELETIVTGDDNGDKQSRLSTTASQMSRVSRRSRSTRHGSHTPHAAGSIAAAGALGLSLRPQTATVLMANAVGFLGFATGAERDRVVRACGRTVEAVHKAVTSQNGVLDSFHGDHFVATFNAARVCGSHAKAACAAALAIARSHGFATSATGDAQRSDAEAASAEPGLVLRCGVATGRCLVGNVGSQAAKAFSTIGAAYTQAAVLERMTRVYGCGVLASRRTCVDAVMSMRYVFVDVVHLPSATAREGSRPTPIGAVLGPRAGFDGAGSHPPSRPLSPTAPGLVVTDAGAVTPPLRAARPARTAPEGDAEWLYVVAQADSGDALTLHNEAMEEAAAGKVSARAEEALEAPAPHGATETLREVLACVRGGGLEGRVARGAAEYYSVVSGRPSVRASKLEARQ